MHLAFHQELERASSPADEAIPQEIPTENEGQEHSYWEEP